MDVDKMKETKPLANGSCPPRNTYFIDEEGFDSYEEAVQAFVENNGRLFAELVFNTGQLQAWCDQKALAASKSQLSHLVLSGYDVETIKNHVETNQESLKASSTLLHDACCFGAAPGVVGFLAKHLPDEVHRCDETYFIENDIKPFSRVTHPINDAMRFGPGVARPSEDDILILAKMASFLLVMGDCFVDGALRLHNCTPVVGSIVNGFSTRMTEVIFALIPSWEGPFSCSRKYREWHRTRNLSFVRGYSINKRVCKLVQDKKSISIQWPKWNQNVLLRLIATAFTSKKLENMTLALYDAQDYEAESSEIQRPNLTLHDLVMSKQRKASSLTTLRLYVSNWKVALCGNSISDILDCIAEFPKLRSLVIASWDVASPPSALGNLLCELIEKDNCRTLSCFIVSLSKWDRSPLESRLLPLVEKNTTLQEFDLQDFPSPTTTLARLCGADNGNELLSCEKIQSYTRLNRCGIAMARIKRTTLSQFVELLGAVQSDVAVESENDAVKVRYSLLREGLEKWLLNNRFFPGKTKSGEHCKKCIGLVRRCHQHPPTPQKDNSKEDEQETKLQRKEEEMRE